MELQKQIENYWEKRADTYAAMIQEEMANETKVRWEKMLTTHPPPHEKLPFHVLDVGTGPGFFSCLLAECGFDVTAIDSSAQMLKVAKENGACYKNQISYHCMDAQNLDFANETFDAIVVRNLTWNLPKPKQAYAEWFRVLKKGGRLLNFDANWYHYLFFPEKKAAFEVDRKNATDLDYCDYWDVENSEVMETLVERLPLNKEKRPQWDTFALFDCGFTRIKAEENVGKNLWTEEEQINFASTPLFMIVAEK